MTLDEWVDVVKAIGADSFKAVACAYLRDRFARPVHFVDGTGDGGVDAWIVKNDDPLVRHAAQFYAGDRNGWRAKLEDDVHKIARFRDSIKHDVGRRLDFARVYFVSALEPNETTFSDYADEVYEEHGIRLESCDARAIASRALQNPRSLLFTHLAERLPGFKSTSDVAVSAREKALLSFAVFDGQAKHARVAVVKNAVLAAAGEHADGCPRAVLEAESCRLLGLSSPSRLVAHAVRDLRAEAQLSIDDSAEQLVRVSSTARASLKTANAVAQAELTGLRQRCIALIEPEISKGRHHRTELAARAVAPLLENLGALIREPVAERLLLALDPTTKPQDASERQAIARWRQTADEMASELDEGPAARLLLQVVKEVASHPFSRRLAAAELNFRLTELDAREFEEALGASQQHILLDASIAMPMLCAKHDGVIESWTTSVAASELHAVAQQRGAKLHVASAHLEEMAAHLYLAKHFAPLFDGPNGADLRRSRNYYVAHFASSETKQERGEFEHFLAAFGLTEQRQKLSMDAVRGELERALRKLLKQYEIERREVEAIDTSSPLPGEPSVRDARLLRHDRAVVGSLALWTRDASWLVCSADRWLREVLNERDILAIDSVGLADLLSLVKSSTATRPQVSVLELALSLNEETAQLASSVWDTIVAINGSSLSNRRFFEKAKAFRDAWVATRRSADADIAEAWSLYRDTGALPPTKTHK